MALDDLPTLDELDFDLVVIGTGLPEAIAASTLSRNKLRVLHIDANKFYGSCAWSTFTLNEFVAFAGENNWEVHGTPPESSSGMYNIDMSPYPLMAESEIVGLLVETNVGRFLEFRHIDVTYTYWGNAMVRIPATKGEIFKSKFSGREKAELGKFLKVVSKTNETEEASGIVLEERDGSFTEFLTSKGVNESMHKFIVHSVLWSPSATISYKDGIRLLQQFQSATGKYGTHNEAFLFAMHGFGDIPQAFCRDCAVYGGTTVLNCPISAVRGGPRPVVSLANGQDVTCSHVVLGPAFGGKPRPLWRCVAIIDSPVMEGREKEEEILRNTSVEVGLFSSCLCVVPPGIFDNDEIILIVQVSQSTRCAPSGKFLVHFCTSSSRGQEALQRCAKAILPEGSYYAIGDVNLQSPLAVVGDENIHSMPGHIVDIHLTGDLAAAKAVVAAILPGARWEPLPQPQFQEGGDDEPATEEGGQAEGAPVEATAPAEGAEK